MTIVVTDAEGREVGRVPFADAASGGPHADRNEIWRLSHFDALTGLANRGLFLERLRMATTGGLRPACAALAIFDVDKLRAINETRGHLAGDALLEHLARRLRGQMHPAETAARVGDDEFALILAENAGSAPVVERVAAVQQLLRQPVEVAGEVLVASVSAGLALFPEHAETDADLLKATEIALDRAKTVGGDDLLVFAPPMWADVHDRFATAAQIRTAVAEGRVFPHYQPKICLKTGRVVGFEALLRWRHPSGDVRLPGTLADVLNDPALSSLIGRHMVRRVIGDLARWRAAGVDFGHVAINASALDLARPGFAEEIIGALAEHDLPASALELEITEAASLERKDQRIEDALRTLSAHGIVLMLDDFGTGRGTLIHLTQFPVGGVKIDRSFVARMHADPNAEAIVSLIISLARSMGLALVAEGVEDARQAVWLLENGCLHAQGFLFSEAVPPEEVPPIAARTFRIRDAKNPSPRNAGTVR